jgi:acyl-CoA synthetase (NDP forming)
LVSTGNQAQLGSEDFIDILLEDRRVTGFALYQEGFLDFNRFKQVAIRSRRMNKPIVMIYPGSNSVSRRSVVNHTGSDCSNYTEQYEELESLGVVMVDTPTALLETIKLISHPDLVCGPKLAAFSCSGGDATLVAEIAYKNKLSLPEPSKHVQERLLTILPEIATPHNPLDCTTQLWGKPEIRLVFETLLMDDYDIALFVQDYPRLECAFDYTTDFREAEWFVQAAQNKGIPAVICSSLSENLNPKVRDHIVGLGAVPLQGVEHAMQAIAAVGKYSNKILSS